MLLRTFMAFEGEIASAMSVSAFFMFSVFHLLTCCNTQHPLLPVSVPIHTEASVYPLPRAIFRMFGNDDLQDVESVNFHCDNILHSVMCDLLIDTRLAS